MKATRLLQGIAGLILIAGITACGSGTPAGNQPTAPQATNPPAAVSSPTQASAQLARACSTTRSWGTVPKVGGVATTDKVTGVQVSAALQSVCVDQVYFLVDGNDTFAGFSVKYLTDTALQVTVKAPGAASIALPAASDYAPLKVVRKVSASASSGGTSVFTIEVAKKLAFTAENQLAGANGSAVVIKISLD